MKIVTSIAPVNIAVIKYWGKRDEELIIPINDSLSATLSLDEMCAKTTIMASPEFTEDKIWLNGKEEKFNNRLLNCIKEIKKRYVKDSNDNNLLTWNIHICSENNFPTAAGLASSAAGYACLAYTLSRLYSIEGDVSSIARLGSGSAVRSMYGGWVKWIAGTREDGIDSISQQVASETHWPEMHVLILVVSDTKKKVGSTVGMRNACLTSELLKYRSKTVVPKRMEDITEAILKKDYETFGKLTMQDSNQFHAVCLDTYPPCVYLNEISHEIINIVHQINDYYGKVKVAYTFDAGPNACIYLLKKEVKEFVSIINHYFPSNNIDEPFFKGIKTDPEPIQESILRHIGGKVTPGALKYIIHTKVGSGPVELKKSSDHLLNNNGLPKKIC